jgi:hypothetical protein
LKRRTNESVCEEDVLKCKDEKLEKSEEKKLGKLLSTDAEIREISRDREKHNICIK